jgi:hypothetical protein
MQLSNAYTLRRVYSAIPSPPFDIPFFMVFNQTSIDYSHWDELINMETMVVVVMEAQAEVLEVDEQMAFLVTATSQCSSHTSFANIIQMLLQGNCFGCFGNCCS